MVSRWLRGLTELAWIVVMMLIGGETPRLLDEDDSNCPYAGGPVPLALACSAQLQSA